MNNKKQAFNLIIWPDFTSVWSKCWGKLF